MNPCELFAEIADRITAVVKQPYRQEPITEEEFDKISDSILLCIEKAKKDAKNS